MRMPEGPFRERRLVEETKILPELVRGRLRLP
jgi:hypothetical protein